MNWFRSMLAVGACLMGAAALAEVEERALEGFERVVFALPGNLVLQRGDAHRVVLEGLPGDLERIETRVSGKELAIRWDDGLLGMFGGRPEGQIQVRVTLPGLRALEVAGSGDVEGGSWLSERLSVEINGSGNARFAELAVEELSLEVAGSGGVAVADLDAAVARIEISGSGDVDLAGAADRQEIEVMGSGDVDAADLEGAEVSVEVLGSGDVAVWATETLSAEIMGSGDIRYRGSPRVEREEFGSGEVRPVD